MTIKPGTRIELKGRDMNMNEVWEPAKIGKWLKISGPRENVPGYHRVIFNDGGSLLCHESGFRVVDNRA